MHFDYHFIDKFWFSGLFISSINVFIDLFIILRVIYIINNVIKDVQCISNFKYKSTIRITNIIIILAD